MFEGDANSKSKVREFASLAPMSMSFLLPHSEFNGTSSPPPPSLAAKQVFPSTCPLKTALFFLDSVEFFAEKSADHFGQSSILGSFAPLAPKTGKGTTLVPSQVACMKTGGGGGRRTELL